MMWALVIVTHLNAMPLVSWHHSRAGCEQQAAVEMAHLAYTGRPVGFVECRLYARPLLRSVTGEVLTRHH